MIISFELPENKSEIDVFETLGEHFEFGRNHFIEFCEQALDICSKTRGRIYHKTLVICLTQF